jgi:hypothetical protein
MDASHRRREADHQSDLNRRPRAHVMQGGVEEKAACRAGTDNGLTFDCGEVVRDQPMWPFDCDLDAIS